jgi:hypothetical protein
MARGVKNTAGNKNRRLLCRNGVDKVTTPASRSPKFFLFNAVSTMLPP